jgi:hypothetical protein
MIERTNEPYRIAVSFERLIEQTPEHAVMLEQAKEYISGLKINPLPEWDYRDCIKSVLNQFGFIADGTYEDAINQEEESVIKTIAQNTIYAKCASCDTESLERMLISVRDIPGVKETRLQTPHYVSKSLNIESTE